MSNHPHRRRRRPAAAAETLAEAYGAVTGWAATLADVEEAKRRSHDAVIRLMGDRRTGGVRWTITQGDGARTTLDRISAGNTDSALAAVYARCRVLIDEKGGYLVVAMAPGRPT